MGTVNVLEPNTIYKLSEKEIFWTGGKYHGDYLDKQYTGQYYTQEQLTHLIKISLERAIEEKLISYERFKRMNKEDTTNTVKIMLEKYGIFETMNFLCNGKLLTEGLTIGE